MRAFAGVVGCVCVFSAACGTENPDVPVPQGGVATADASLPATAPGTGGRGVSSGAGGSALGGSVGTGGSSRGAGGEGGVGMGTGGAGAGGSANAGGSVVSGRDASGRDASVLGAAGLDARQGGPDKNGDAPGGGAIDGLAPVGPDTEPGRLAGITRLHNDVRAMIQGAGLPPLSWDPQLAATAQSYAALCVYKHSMAAGLGENIAAFAPGGSGTAARTVKSWADEKVDYNYQANTCAAGKQCGHYTQIVWKATLRLGCGVQTCTSGSPFGAQFPTWDFYVCNYTPPGNYVGRKPY